MSRGINKITIVGNIGKKDILSGGCRISIATNERWTDKNKEVKEHTEWHRVTFFGKLSDIVNQHLNVGDKVYVEGTVRSSKYTDKQGIERHNYQIIGHTLEMLGKGNPKEEIVSPPAAPTADLPDDLDDLPF